MLKRHRILWKILRPLIIVFLYIKFGYTFKTAKNLPDNYIILSNHTTDFDPLFLSVSFKNNIRFVASEHIARWKHAFKFIDYIFHPILRYKGTNGASTVKEMLKTLRNGDNVCLFAEGSRCWNGITAPFLPSTGKVVKNSKAALVTYKITGGYFVSPLWGNGKTRRGKISGAVVNVYTADELADMSVDEINTIIRNDLHEDAYLTQENIKSKYKSKRLAENLECMSYYCPNCNSLDTLRSSKNSVHCLKCNHSFTYDEYGILHGLENKNFTNVKDLFVFLRDKTLEDANCKVTYNCDSSKIIQVKNHQEFEPLFGNLILSNEFLCCADIKISLDDILDFNMHGSQAILFSTKDTYYEIIIPKEHSALKFYMLFQAYKYGDINRFNF